jgi:hypothetical protein
LGPDTGSIELVGSDVELGLGSGVLGSGVESIEITGDVSLGFLGDSGGNGVLSGGISSTPGTGNGDEVSDGLLVDGELGLLVRDGLGKVGNVVCGLTGGNGTGGSVSLESLELLPEVTLEGLLDIIQGWSSLGLGLGGGEHQWDCDVLKHFAK